MSALIDELLQLRHRLEYSILDVDRCIASATPRTVQLYSNLMLYDTDDDGDVEDPLAGEYATYGIARSHSISQRHFASGSTFDRPEKLVARLAQIPADFDGPITINWEGDALRSLIRPDPSDPGERDVHIDGFLQVLNEVRNHCPDALVGYYGLPSREYWAQTDAWRETMRYLAPIFEASSGVFPSCYDLYGTMPGRDEERLSEIARFAVELAQGRPVFPFVWDRYHNSTATWGYKTIPTSEWTDLLVAILSAEHDGRHPAGLVAWGADPYYWGAAMARVKRGPDTVNYLYRSDKYDRIRSVYAEEAREMWDNDQMHDYLAQRYQRTYAIMAEAARRVTS